MPVEEVVQNNNESCIEIWDFKVVIEKDALFKAIEKNFGNRQDRKVKIYKR